MPAATAAACRDTASHSFQDGIIEEWSASAACYVIVGATERYAVQFHQFTIEEEGEQLVLKVTRCTHVQLPPGFSPDLDVEVPEQNGGLEAGAEAALGATAGASCAMCGVQVMRRCVFGEHARMPHARVSNCMCVQTYAFMSSMCS